MSRPGEILAAVEGIKADIADLRTQLAAVKAAVAEIIPRTLVPGDELVWTHGKRPKFWGDHEVRGAVVAMHRQTTIEAARKKLTAWFGEERKPSLSRSIGSGA